jgi:radical SAM superfamily enzyme YgiQ (UPF0313 family)
MPNHVAILPRGRIMDKSSVKVDFVNFSEYVDESISYPMGILYISACLKRNGFTNVGYVDHFCMLRKMEEMKHDPISQNQFRQMPEIHKNNLEDLLKYLEERQPNIILLGPVTSVYLVELVDLVPRLRKNFPEQLIVAGGPHFGKEDGLDTELLEVCAELDAIALGEAEETIVDVAELYYQTYCLNDDSLPSRVGLRGELAKVLGLRTRGNEAKRRPPPKLENLPPPDMELLESYWKNQPIRMYYRYSIAKRRNPTIRTSRQIFEGDEGEWGAFDEDVPYFGEFKSKSDYFPFGVITGSRGCPYKCTFCCSSGQRRVHTAEFVFNQIADLNEMFGIRQFVFFDPLFTTSAEAEQRRILELCNMICRSGLNIRYAIEIRADIILNLPEELLSLMIRSGCVEFNLGLEKGSDRLLEMTSKGMTTKTHRDAVAKLRKVANKVGREVLVNGTFILGGPSENQNDIRETLIHCISLNLDEVAFYPLEIHPGTPSYKMALDKGLLQPSLAPYLNVESYPLYATDVLSASYLCNVRNLGKALFDQFDKLKGKIQEMERQFFSETKRDELSKFNIKRTKKLQQYFESCIGKALDYENECAVVEKEIVSVEKKLLRKYKDYDPNYDDYHIGDLQEAWDEYLARIEQLFQGARKRTRFFNFEPNAY